MTYFERGNAYLLLEEFKNALRDFNQALELKPNYTPAIIKKAKIYMKQCKFDSARLHYDAVVSYKIFSFYYYLWS